jgi:hypothetical protein
VADSSQSQSQSQSPARTLLTNLAISIVVEMAGAALTRRLRRGRQSEDASDTTAPPGAIRLLIGALMAELIETAVSEVWWQRRRMGAAIEHAAAAQSVTASNGHSGGLSRAG